MDSVWTRISAELASRKKGLQWLADELGCSVQRVQNWTTRGVPPSAYAQIADALGWTVDRLLGSVQDRTGGDVLSHDEAKMLRSYRRLSDDADRAQAIGYVDALADRPTKTRAAPMTMAELDASDAARKTVPSIERRHPDRLVKNHPLRRESDKKRSA